MSKKKRKNKNNYVVKIPTELEKSISEYIQEHAEEIADEVDSAFFREEENIKNSILTEIKGYLEKNPVHYEWEYDGCPYDFSGEIVKAGTINLNQTIEQFLDEEYSGSKVATHSSHYGFHYKNYDDELSYLTIDIAGSIQKKTTKEILKKVFSEVDDEILDDIICNEHDTIYELCVANEFFTSLGAIQYLNIEDMTLEEVLQLYS